MNAQRPGALIVPLKALGEAVAISKDSNVSVPKALWARTLTQIHTEVFEIRLCRLLIKQSDRIGHIVKAVRDASGYYRTGSSHVREIDYLGICLGRSAQ